MSIRIITYAGDLIPNDTLLDVLGLQGKEYSYFVATRELERRRSNSNSVVPEHQWAQPQGNETSRQPRLAFYPAIRHLMNRSDLLTRAEERLLLLRVIKEFEQDSVVAAQLKHDVFAWRNVIAEMWEEDRDLRESIPADLENQLVNTKVGQVLQDLQRQYVKYQEDVEKITFEQAAIFFLKHGYRPTPNIVMEGFTYLTAMQIRFIETCKQFDVMIHFIYPYNESQKWGFDRLRRTYEPFARDAESKSISTEIEKRPPELLHLYRYLFSSGIPEELEVTLSEEPAVTLEAHNHRHSEIEMCIQRIGKYLSAGWKADDLTIITRNPQEMHTLLREEAELQKLPVDLGILPRQLLLTPIGRFALTLYNVWIGEHLSLSVEEFEAILASGWLGAKVQQTVERFRALKAQVFFARGLKAQAGEWRDRLSYLRRQHHSWPSDSRVPAAQVDIDTIDLWEATVGQIEAICRSLYAAGEGSISDHIKALQDQLLQLAPEQMFKKEREVVDRIFEVFRELQEGASLRMLPDEFGEVLNSLVREQKDRRFAEKQDAELSRDDDRVWLTTPEGIDNSISPVVFYLGVDNKRVPRPYTDPWPFIRDEIDGHQLNERYMFLAVIRSATRYLHFSYSHMDEDGVYNPSMYLQEVERLLAKPLENKTISSEHESVEEKPEISPVLGRTRREAYTLHEIAHFALCPFRYKLERMDRTARHYTSEYQITFLAQGTWLSDIFQYLADSKEKARGSENVFKMLKRAMDATQEKNRNTFFGLDSVKWFSITQWVERRLREFSDYYSKYDISFYPPGKCEIPIIDEDRLTTIDATPKFVVKSGKITYAVTEDLYLEEWLVTPKPDDESLGSNTIDEIPVFSTQYAAAQWWRTTMETAHRCSVDRSFAEKNYQKIQKEIAGRIEYIEKGHYPKHSGKHCTYCPVKDTCLGLPEQR